MRTANLTRNLIVIGPGSYSQLQPRIVILLSALPAVMFYLSDQLDA